jgi:ubiquinone/menaquinone biosynthesis C-methylase UbiE
VAETADGTGLALSEGVAEQMPLVGDAARAIVAATAAHWFDRPAFYAEAPRVLLPGGVIAIVEYIATRRAARLPRADRVHGAIWLTKGLCARGLPP